VRQLLLFAVFFKPSALPRGSRSGFCKPGSAAAFAVVFAWPLLSPLPQKGGTLTIQSGSSS
jgi:hypothetical protein